jgi:hypothetical protein
MTEALQWLETTGPGLIARESLYGFPILVGIHILGLILSVGILLWVDLRMLGISLKGRRLSEVYGNLAGWFVVGFGVMFLSGAVLFAGFASSAYDNVYFRIKITAMILAGINAMAFHLLVRRMPAHADSGDPGGLVRAAGMLSLVLWGTVIVCGRMMSYTLF